MGYCISVSVPNFNIKKENKEAALKAIQNLAGQETIQIGHKPHFSWVNHDFYTIDNLEQMFKEWRWHPFTDQEGNITELEFTGEKYGDDEILFKTLAPFIEDNSQINFRGEDGDKWQYRFNNKQMKKFQGRVSYEEV